MTQYQDAGRYQATTKASQTKIVFVAHSMGGIVTKKVGICPIIIRAGGKANNW